MVPQSPQVPFDRKYTRARETRAERVERLLAGLGKPPSSDGPVPGFDYNTATAIATSRNWTRTTDETPQI